MRGGLGVWKCWRGYWQGRYSCHSDGAHCQRNACKEPQTLHVSYTSVQNSPRVGLALWMLPVVGEMERFFSCKRLFAGPPRSGEIHKLLSLSTSATHPARQRNMPDGFSRRYSCSLSVIYCLSSPALIVPNLILRAKADKRN